MTQSHNISFSIIVPVFNRPNEVKELFESLVQQFYKDFEVVIVEDGSSLKSDKIVEKFKNDLAIRYFYKQNSGPGQSRNYGMERANGNYFIILDSDVILPGNYLSIVNKHLNESYVDAYGGPDAAAPNFSPMQKAINFAMTSVFTTGGIRGRSEQAEKFHPRSFNMGIAKKVFEKTGGFSKMRFGEDIDFSIRIMQSGFKTALFTDAFVYHKRRNTLMQFYKQVYNSGIARINLYKLHPNSLKIVHFFPALFLLGFVGGVIFYAFGIKWLLLLYLLYFLLIFVTVIWKEKSTKIAVLSVLTSFTMLWAYGLGFLTAFWKRIVLKKDAFDSFQNTFYD